MADVKTLLSHLNERCAAWIANTKIALGELTADVKPAHLLDLCLMLRDEPVFGFNQLIDVCGVDYLHYGLDDWQTESSTETGFSRGVTSALQRSAPPLVQEQALLVRSIKSENEGVSAFLAETTEEKSNRFAVVYHLLSLTNNHRIRLRVNIPDESELMVDSVISIWPSADWYEREAFDLFGILFRGHPDLRRLLTDYGFVGHPFRKDFPLIGKVEARYDAALKRVVYEPVSIMPRILEPKVIRRDNRYSSVSDKGESHG